MAEYDIDCLGRIAHGKWGYLPANVVLPIGTRVRVRPSIEEPFHDSETGVVHELITPLSDPDIWGVDCYVRLDGEKGQIKRFKTKILDVISFNNIV